MKFYLFANARPAVPFSFDGGAERTTHSLVSGLARSGLAVVQVCAFPRNSIELAVANATAMGVAFSRKNGQVDPGLNVSTNKKHLLVRDGLLWIIAVDLSEFQAVCSALLSDVSAELVVTWLKGSADVIEVASKLNVPAVLRIVGPESPEGYPPVAPDTVILANSPTTAQIAGQHYGRDVGFLLGVIDHASYVAGIKTPRYITFINPRSEKGVDLFCKVAALLPDLPFLVVRGWSRERLKPDESQALEFMASLPNVRLLSPTGEMREVYGVTRLLMLPSCWQESWARVIGEAQANGIPVIASNRGSSPLSVGRGGVILDYGQPDLWAAVIRMVYQDENLQNTLAANALLNIRRFDAATLIGHYADFFSACARRARVTLPQTIESRVKIYVAERNGQRLPQIHTREIPMCADCDVAEPACA